MRPAGIIGIVLIVAGVLALAYQGIRYTTRETVVDLGPIHATAEREKTIPLPPSAAGQCRRADPVGPGAAVRAADGPSARGARRRLIANSDLGGSAGLQRLAPAESFSRARHVRRRARLVLDLRSISKRDPAG